MTLGGSSSTPSRMRVNRPRPLHALPASVPRSRARSNSRHINLTAEQVIINAHGKSGKILLRVMNFMYGIIFIFFFFADGEKKFSLPKNVGLLHYLL